MRARNIKPGFFHNEHLLQMDPIVRLLFVGLWCMADRRGLLEDRPLRIKIELFPADDLNVNDALDELQAAGLVLRYMGSNGRKTIKVNKFHIHQRPHKTERNNASLVEPGESALQPGESACRNALIPDSGFLIPDSGFTDSLIPSSPSDARGLPAASASGARVIVEPEAGIESESGPNDDDAPPMPVKGVACMIADVASARAWGTSESATPPPSNDRHPIHATAPPTPSVAHRGAQELQDGPAFSAARQLASLRHTQDTAFQASEHLIDVWAKPLARLHHRDGRSWDEISDVMRWAFENSTWWAGRILNGSDLAKNYDRIRGQWYADQREAEGQAAKQVSDPQTLRAVYGSLEFELAESGVDAAREWITRQPEKIRAKLTARLNRISSTTEATA